MTIWILAVLLVASVAALGYRQGGIKVAFSFVGIVLGAMLAVPLGNLLKPLLVILGVKHPLAVYLVAPAIVFVVISALFKGGAAAVHHKVDVYYKYRAGDLRLALWERVNRRLGLCLGLANGVLYLILISFVIYSIGYATVQLASEEGDPRWMRVINRLAKDMDSSGFAKVPRAMDKRTLWYDSADLAGLLYNNPLLEARLARYPAFLALAERSEFQSLGSDQEFAEMRQRREPIFSLLKHQNVEPVMKDPEMVKNIWGTVSADMADLSKYLRTGVSEKYSREPILGRWKFDVNYAIIMVRKAKPNMSSKDAQALKRWTAAAFGKTSLVVMTGNQLVLKEFPQTRQPTADPNAATGTQNIAGQWKSADGGYELSFSGGPTVNATVEGDRLRFNYEGVEMAFYREL